MLKEKLTVGADEGHVSIISYLGNTASNEIYLKEVSLRCLHRGKISTFLK